MPLIRFLPTVTPGQPAPGETLADIAKSHGTNPATLQKVNPNLGGQEPVAGAVINVPIPPKKGEEAPVPMPPPPPAPGSTPVQIPNVPLFTYPATSDAPKDLQGQAVGCDVILRWNDLSEDETRHEIWTALGMLSPQVVASLNPSPAKGPAWYKFRALQTGYVTFWVEAVNPKGKQPSNEIGLSIDPQNCAWTMGSGQYLMVQVFDMTIKGNYTKVYCFVAYENNEAQRIPENTSDFIQVQDMR